MEGKQLQDERKVEKGKQGECPTAHLSMQAQLFWLCNEESWQIRQQINDY